MEKLITPFLRPIALAITLVMASSGPLCAQSPLHAAAFPAFDRIYQQSLRAMQNEARAVGLRIDTDIDVLVKTATSHVLLAAIEGFENIVLEEEGLNEFDFGFADVAGIEGLPDGFYRLHYLIDLSHPEEAIVSWINSRGEAFDFALEITDDPHPERGPRKGLTSEGGGTFDLTSYVPLRGQSIGKACDQFGRVLG